MKEVLKEEVWKQVIATVFRVIGAIIAGLLLIYYFKAG